MTKSSFEFLGLNGQCRLLSYDKNLRHDLKLLEVDESVLEEIVGGRLVF